MRAPPPEVEAYLAALPPTHRAALERLRRQILAAAPRATEKLSYQMPAFEHEGLLVWMAAFRDHCSFFPMRSGVALALRSGLAGFETSKGTIRFAPGKPIPAGLVRMVVKARVAENEERAAKRAAARRARQPRSKRVMHTRTLSRHDMRSGARSRSSPWRSRLKVDPVPRLLSAGPAIRYFARRDLLGERVPPVDVLWGLPEPARLVRRQLPDGSWHDPGKTRSGQDYSQLETFRSLSVLVGKYGMTKRHPAVAGAAEFLFSRQSRDGDFRGIYGRQLAPTYSGAILELLVKSGYADDARVSMCFDWFRANRQDDGGWAIPLRTCGLVYSADALRSPMVGADVTRPSSHLVTGMVLRAFAAHPARRRTAIARSAGGLLADRLFQPDAYSDRRGREYWLRVSFPFWFTDVVSALDSLSRLGFDRADARIDGAACLLERRQRESGSFGLKLLRDKDPEARDWVGLAICRVLRRLCELETPITC